MKKRQKRKLIFDEEGIKLFAAQLQMTRKAKGFTQEKLSNESGITLSQIARIETCRINPTLSTVFALCRAMKISPKELFDFWN